MSTGMHCGLLPTIKRTHALIPCLYCHSNPLPATYHICRTMALTFPIFRHKWAHNYNKKCYPIRSLPTVHKENVATIFTPILVSKKDTEDFWRNWFEVTRKTVYFLHIYTAKYTIFRFTSNQVRQKSPGPLFDTTIGVKIAVKCPLCT